MKLCITANGSNLESSTNTAFGRAPWLIFIDPESMALQAMKNSAANASQGAGIGAAQLVADNGAAAVLTSRVGPRLRSSAAAGVKFMKVYQKPRSNLLYSNLTRVIFQLTPTQEVKQ